MSFTDLSLAACSLRESAEVEASARSQRETAEAKAAGRPPTSKRVGASGSSALTGEADAGRAVAAAPSLVDVRMDEHWRAVSAGTRRGWHISMGGWHDRSSTFFCRLRQMLMFVTDGASQLSSYPIRHQPCKAHALSFVFVQFFLK